MKQFIKRMQCIFFKTSISLSILATSLIACTKDGGYGSNNPGTPGGTGASVLAAAGDSSTIVGTVNVFRHLLGDSLNIIPGKTTGRREVNWDAVPATFTNNNNFPGDFFNSTVDADPAGRKRGLVMLSAGAIFRVDSTEFSQVDASYANEFEPFSKKRLFTNVGSNVTTVTFKVPGTSTDAFVNGFGVIFSDVDDDNSTTLEFFSNGESLGIFKAPSHPASGNFSFLGVKFKDAKITSIKITSGNTVIGTGTKDGGSKDLVVMDDFLYNEPNAGK